MSNIVATVLELNDITNTYDRRKVVDSVSLSLGQGETFGLVGTNGSGKTTAIRIAPDIIQPDSSSVSLLACSE